MNNKIEVRKLKIDQKSVECISNPIFSKKYEPTLWYKHNLPKKLILPKFNSSPSWLITIQTNLSHQNNVFFARPPEST